jgi:hypothetical protein
MIYGELKPKSKFLGNSAATLMGGENRVVLLDRPEDKEYEITMPNMCVYVVRRKDEIAVLTSSSLLLGMREVFSLERWSLS